MAAMNPTSGRRKASASIVKPLDYRPADHAAPASKETIGSQTALRQSQPSATDSSLGQQSAPVRTSAMRGPVPVAFWLALIACAAGWIGGFALANRSSASAEAIISAVPLFDQASELLVLTPERLFFRIPVSPAHNDRWIRNLHLESIPSLQPVPVPSFHALQTWQTATRVLVQPPLSQDEVIDWWSLRRRDVRFGFARTLPNGGFILLDLEGNSLVGWMSAQQAADLFR